MQGMRQSECEHEPQGRKKEKEKKVKKQSQGLIDLLILHDT